MKKVLFLFVVTLLTCNLFAADTTFVTVQIGGASKSSLIEIKSQVTGAVINGTIANVVIQNNSPEVAAVASSPTNQASIKVTPVAAGIGTAIVSCQATYTDPGDGLQKTETKSIVIKYTVIGAPHGVKLALTFN